MRVLLINPPDDLGMIGGGAVFVSRIEPLGILYIAAVCRQAGHDVSVIDAFAEELSTEQLRRRIEQFKPEVVGFTSFTSNGGFLYTFGQQLKRELSGMLVVFGNVHASVYAEHYLLNKCCDVVVHGEGEYAFLGIIRAQENRQSLESVPSLSFLHNGRFLTTSVPHIVDDISQLPFPARDMVNQELYDIGPISNSRLKASRKGKRSKHMFSSRGCPNRCVFCVVHNNLKQRFNSIDKVVNEMEVLVKEYNTDYIFFMDSLFMSDKLRTMKLCQEIRRRKLEVSWGCEAHVNFVDEELVRDMESAGCSDMNFGIESGVQRLLDTIRKGIRLERVEAVIRTVKEHSKINAMGLFILGLPGETYGDSLQTIEFAKRLPIDMAQFSILTPYPGSPLFNELKEKGEIETGIKADGTIDISVWPRYSAYISYTNNDMIWTTPGLSSKKLKQLQKRALRSFYFRPRPFLKQLKRMHWSDLPIFLKAFKNTFL
jgi:radical SAM superfamily enzyme YgiQ (UPF0313 family)